MKSHQEHTDDMEAMKRAAFDDAAREERGGKSKVPHRKHGYFPSNMQPAKKKRKK